jgi:hypothetical protein
MSTSNPWVDFLSDHKPATPFEPTAHMGYFIAQGIEPEEGIIANDLIYRLQVMNISLGSLNEDVVDKLYKRIDSPERELLLNMVKAVNEGRVDPQYQALAYHWINGRVDMHDNPIHRYQIMELVQEMRKSKVIE